MNLSKRLSAIVELIPTCRCVADIGTDHACVPVEAVKRGICKTAIAADVREGPLSRARAHIADAGLSERIRVLLSDGFDELKEGDADCAVITGMGGLTILDILKRGRPKDMGIRTMVLSPQSEEKEVRQFLYENDFRTDEERMVFEDDKYYPLIRVRCGEKDTYAELFRDIPEEALFRYGGILVRKRDAVLKEKLLHDCETYTSIRKALEKSTDTERKHEIQTLLSQAQLLLDKMNQKVREKDAGAYD